MEEYSGLKKSRLGRSALYVLAVLVLIIMVYPFFYTMMSAFKTPEEFVSKAQYALPDGLYLPFNRKHRGILQAAVRRSRPSAKRWKTRYV